MEGKKRRKKELLSSLTARLNRLAREDDFCRPFVAFNVYGDHYSLLGWLVKLFNARLSPKR